MLKYIDILLKNDDVNQELVERNDYLYNQLVTTLYKLKNEDLKFIFNYLTFSVRIKK